MCGTWCFQRVNPTVSPIPYGLCPPGFQARFFNDVDDGRWALDGPITWSTFTAPPVFTGTLPVIAFNTHAAPNQPVPGVQGTFWSARFQGWLLVPRDGTYRFFLDRLDDGGRLFLGDELVFTSWKVHPPRDEAMAGRTLKAGIIPLTVEYAQGPAFEASLFLSWEGPGFEKELLAPIGQGPSRPTLPPIPTPTPTATPTPTPTPTPMPTPTPVSIPVGTKWLVWEFVLFQPGSWPSSVFNANGMTVQFISEGGRDNMWPHPSPCTLGDYCYRVHYQVAVPITDTPPVQAYAFWEAPAGGWPRWGIYRYVGQWNGERFEVIADGVPQTYGAIWLWGSTSRLNGQYGRLLLGLHGGDMLGGEICSDWGGFCDIGYCLCPFQGTTLERSLSWTSPAWGGVRFQGLIEVKTENSGSKRGAFSVHLGLTSASPPPTPTPASLHR